MRCFEGRVYDMQRDAWRACERCSGSGRWWFTSTPSQSAVHGSAASNPHQAGVPIAGLRFLRVAGWGWVAEIGCCIAGFAHPVEKSELIYSSISILGKYTV